MIKPNERIKIFTHTDLDGAGAIVILGVVNLSYDYTLAYPDPPEGEYTRVSVGRYIAEFIESGEYKDYDKVFITDLYINPKTAALIDSVNDDGRFKLFDHHIDSTNYDYEWITAMVSINDVATCGTELFWDYVASENNLVDKMSYRQFSICTRFVESVRLYDTWDWVNKPSMFSQLAQDLNEIYHMHGVDKFTKSFINKLLSCDGEFVGEVEKAMLDIIKRERDAYVEKKFKSVNILDIGGLKYAVVFTERFNNDVLTYILNNVECDVAASINIGNNVVSLRTLSDEISVAVIAKKYNGGGHRKAAGFVFSDTFGRNLIKTIFGD